MTTDQLGDLSIESLRTGLHRVAEWVADYRQRIEQRRISPQIVPGDVKAAFPASLQRGPLELDALLNMFERVIAANVVHWGHPAFLGYFGSTTTAPGIIAETLAAALNVSAMTWRVSPAATELEQVVLRWLAQMLGLPTEFEGVVYDTASVATLHALAAARERSGGTIRRDGLSGGLPMAIYASDQAHSSIDKAAIVLGFGERYVRHIRSDRSQQIDVAALKEAIATDRRNGVRPCAVVATVGTTSTGAVDSIAAVADACAAHDLWLHVDAAYGGAMAILPEGRWVFDGIERCDSVVVNPHKWLFVPLDFSTLYTRRIDLLRRVLAIKPAYLAGDADADGMPDVMDVSFQLGRRFRALKAWMVWSAFGRDGLEARVREHLRLARLLATCVETDADFELVAPVTMGVVCLRARRDGVTVAEDELNEALVAAVNDSGEAYVTATTVSGRRVVRVGFGNVCTTEVHVLRAWDVLRRTRSALCRLKTQQ